MHLVSFFVDRGYLPVNMDLDYSFLFYVFMPYRDQKSLLRKISNNEPLYNTIVD